MEWNLTKCGIPTLIYTHILANLDEELHVFVCISPYKCKFRIKTFFTLFL
jgi:hypothetical protein